MSRIRKSTLRSGIKVITEEMPDVESCSIGFWIRTGSRNETEKTGGVSHFIEHLLFKGTDRRSALDISREIESVGGILNAFTSREFTCLYAKVLKKDLPLAIDLLSDMLMNPRFDSEELDRERMVVLQEIRMVEDTPDELVHDLFAERFWPGHPLGRPILGTRDTITTVTRDDVLGYYHDNYRPGNIFVSAAGGLEHDQVVKLMNAALRGVKKAKGPERPTKARTRRGSHLVKRKLEQVHLCLGVPATSQADPERYKVYLLTTILGGGMSSRLFQEIREKRGLAYSVFSYLSLCRDSGAMTVYAGTTKESFSEVVNLVMDEWAKLRRGVAEEELSHAREQLKGGMLLGLETTDNRMTKLAKDEIYFGRYVPVKKIVREIDRVTPDDLRDTARKLLLARRATLVAIGSVSGKGLPKAFS